MGKKEEASKAVKNSLEALNPKKKKYITTIVIETDYNPKELEEGFASFFINLWSNPNTQVLKKETKEKTEAGDL